MSKLTTSEYKPLTERDLKKYFIIMLGCWLTVPAFMFLGLLTGAF